MTDLPMSSTEPTSFEEWVTVSDAATRARVDTSTVRHWYRSGQLPTQRSEGERGAFLVPLEPVLALAARLGDEEDDGAASESPMNAAYWSTQIEAARDEATTARQAATDARQRLGEIEDQLSFLRSQLAEMSEENRNLREQVEATTATLAASKQEVEQLREEAASVSSITDFSWLERTKAYEGPARPQQRLGVNTLSGMLADVQADEPATASSGPSDIVEDPEAVADLLAQVIEASDDDVVEAPAHYPGYGYHDDDLIPESNKKRRRG